MKRLTSVLLAGCVLVTGCGTYSSWSKRREARALERSIEDQRKKLEKMSPSALERAEAASREKAIAQYEKILQEYSDVGREEMDEALYLLGRLLFEREQNEFQRQQKSFEDLRQRAEAAGDPIPEEPRPRYPGARTVYERLLREFPESSLREDAMYDLGYILYEEGDHGRSVELFEQLVREKPRSRYAAEVHFRLGEVRFEDYDLAGAEEHYRAVLRLGQTDLTEKSLFKLGWVYYNLDRFDEAKAVLADLLQREVRKVLKEGREFAPTPILFFPGPRRPVLKDLEPKGSDLYEETLEIIARVHSESGGADELLRFIRAQSRGQKDVLFAAPLMHRLALVEKERAQFVAAARTYQLLLDTFPTFRDAPEIELEYVQVLIDQKQLDRAAAAREAMLEKYDTGSAWARANPEEEIRDQALKAARKGLSWSIRYWHARGLENQKEQGGVPQELRRAIGLYERYLSRFPEGESSYGKRFRYGQALYAAGDYAKAADAFRQVSFDPELDAKREEAAFARILSVEELAKHHRPPLPQAVLDGLVTAYEDYIALNPDAERAPALLFKEGQLYFENEQYPPAITAFMRLIEGYPAHPLATEAPDLIAQSHFRLGDYALVEEWAEKALRVTGSDAGERRSQIENLFALSVFRQGEKAEEEKDFEEARRNYLRLVDRAPGNETAPRALYNAAIATENAGDAGEAARLLERLLSDYVESDLATDAAVRLAKHYENEPGGSERLIRIYERVADFHGESPHAEEFLYLAGKLAVKENRAPETLRLFEKYLSRYRAAGAPAERTQTALYHLGTTYADLGSPQLARLNLQQFLAQPRPAGAGPGDTGEGYAVAQARAELLLGRMVEDEYRNLQIAPPIERSFQQKQKLLDQVVARYAAPVASGLSPIATEASWRIGQAYEEFAASLERAPKPPGLTAEELMEYEQLLEEQIRPFLRKAVEAYRVTARASRDKEIHDEWVERSRARLAHVAPRAFVRSPRPQYVALPDPPEPPPAVLRTFAGSPVTPGSGPGFFGSLVTGGDEARRGAFAAGLEAALASPPDWAEAAGRFTDAAKDGPPEAGFNACVAHAWKGDLPAAEAAVEDVLRRHPTFQPGIFLAAWVRERLGKRDLAGADYRRAAESPEATAAQRVGWARFLEGQQRETEALEAYRLALEADPNDGEAALGVARLGGASSEELDALLAKLSGKPPLLVDLGILAADRGALPVAERAFGAARVSLNPEDPQALAVVLNDEALVAQSIGQLARAETLLAQAIEADGNLAALANTAGILRMQRGEFESAEADFQKAVDGPASSASAWANLGILNELYFGMPERALECYSRYLATRPPDASVVSGWVQEIREGMS